MGMFRRSHAVVLMCAVAAAGCGAADDRIDPGDLELRDLLGLAPPVAAAWDGEQRAAAREVLGAALAAERAQALAGDVGAMTDARRVAQALAALDRDRLARDDDALPLVRLRRAADGGTELAAVGGDGAARALRSATAGDDGPPVELWLDHGWTGEPGWARLPAEGLEVLGALAREAGHAGGPAIVEPVPRLAVVAAYLVRPEGAPRLLVNPVLLAALEPADDGAAGEVARAADGEGAGAGVGVGVGGGEPAVAGRAGDGAPVVPVAGDGVSALEGNPYSFYGSVGECASAQRRRCEACVPAGNCAPVTDSGDGAAECATLLADGARGTFLLCANLSLSISTVAGCVRDAAPTCPFTTDAARSLATLGENARFVDDPACGEPLDGCLADIYGAPPAPFPGVDGGVDPADPRDLDVDCGSSCESGGCSPSCELEGLNCENPLSCDSSCSSSNEQSGCAGNCEGCGTTDSDGGGGGCGGCDSEGSSGDGGCGGGDGGGDGGGCSGGDGGGGGCSGGDCGGDGGGCGGDGGSCGSSDGGGCGDSGGGGGCSGGGGGSSNSCNVGGRRGPPPGLTLAMAVLWAILPVPAAALLRRRRRRDRPGGPGGDGGDGGDPSAGGPVAGASDAGGRRDDDRRADDEVAS